MADGEINSQAFQLAELRSERVRIKTVFGVFGILLVLVLARGLMSLAEGYRGEAWPFAILLAAMTVYESLRLRSIEQALASGAPLSTANRTVNLFAESLLPTIALVLQVHTSLIGPHRALTSPVSLGYFLFIILSILHLDPALSRLAGVFSAAGYVAASVYTFIVFPEVGASGGVVVYGMCVSYAGLLLLAGFAAGAVAHQVRIHVIAALGEAESRAKIAQFEHDLGIARSIQQGLLPQAPPQVAGFDIAGWNLPADQTGGDYFDWQQLPDGKVALTLADVTGHGIGPALIMAACRAYARAGFAEERDLQALLGRLNHLLYEDLPTEKFVTFAAGLLDPREATLQLISAGHGPLLFYSAAQDRFRSYEAQGLPLALLPRFGYSAAETLAFAPGDIFVSVTDGFTEWANAGDDDFGVQRTEQVIRECRAKPAAEIIAELYSAVVHFSGSTPQLDDLTALVVKRI